MHISRVESPLMHDGGLLGDVDLHLFNEGTHTRLYEKLGAHVIEDGRRRGVRFAVWAPNAVGVSVMGDFNGWDADNHRLFPRGSSGIWEGFISGVERGAAYKFRVRSSRQGYEVDKADPFAFYAEPAPRTASLVWSDKYQWGDREWMADRRKKNALESPIAIYEVHLGSFRRQPEEENRPLRYRELAPWLIQRVKDIGFTHVELLPVMEHPFYGSWGYQPTGFFAATSRYGTPEDLKFLVDQLHKNDIGVILDWVPAHFPDDEHGLVYFDGTHLFEHSDPREGRHPDWGSAVFNFGRHEVRSFLISSAFYWLDRFHVDGLRVDAVASMLYRDYSRAPGDWIPNQYGGRENIEAIDFLRQLNRSVYGAFPDVQMIAEESTAWPMVSRPIEVGGLGFGLKWDMGWMHDSLDYMSKDPVHRKYHHDQITFRSLYAAHENFVLPLSHDEVVHGKGSLISKMPGDDWQKFANLRVLFGMMFAQPGKKLLFMGGEIGQWREWSHESSIDWHLLDQGPFHGGLQRWVGDLARLYRREPSMHLWDCDSRGFQWIDARASDQSVYAFQRRGPREGDSIVAVFNCTPVPRRNYKIGVDEPGTWTELLNSDAQIYGGSGVGNLGGVESAPVPMHGRWHSLTLTLPPLAALFLKREPSTSYR